MDGTIVSPAQVADAAATLPAFAEKRLVVVKGAPWFGAAKGKGKAADEEGETEETPEREAEPLLRYLQDPSPYTCLVLVAGEKIDLRRKLVKAAQKTGQVLEFPALRGGELNNWIEERFQSCGKKVERRGVEFLTVAVGSNLSLLAGEIEKIALFSVADGKVTLSDVMGLASRSSAINVFDLMDAVGGRDASTAIHQLREIVKSGEPEIKILALLAKNLRVMLQAKTLAGQGIGENELVGQLGVHPYMAKKGLQQSRNFTARELADDLEVLLEADLAMKTGKGEVLGLMEMAILKMCHRAN